VSTIGKNNLKFYPLSERLKAPPVNSIQIKSSVERILYTSRNSLMNMMIWSGDTRALKHGKGLRSSQGQQMLSSNHRFQKSLKKFVQERTARITEGNKQQLKMDSLASTGRLGQPNIPTVVWNQITTAGTLTDPKLFGASLTKG